MRVTPDVFVAMSTLRGTIVFEDVHVHVPVLLGTVRQGRRSEAVASWLLTELDDREDVGTELLDLRAIDLTLDDAGKTTADPAFADAVDGADGIVMVVPEYNGSYPGLLKHALDTLYDEYQHKAVGLATVSAGGLGGSRLAATLLPVLRDFGLVAIRRDLTVSRAGSAFDTDGRPAEERLAQRADRFLDDLLWMTRALKMAREKGDG